MPWTVEIIQNTDVRNTGTVTAAYDEGGPVLFTYIGGQLRFKNDTQTTNFANRARTALAAFLANRAEDDATKAAIATKLNAP